MPVYRCHAAAAARNTKRRHAARWFASSATPAMRSFGCLRVAITAGRSASRLDCEMASFSDAPFFRREGYRRAHDTSRAFR